MSPAARAETLVDVSSTSARDRVARGVAVVIIGGAGGGMALLAAAGPVTADLDVCANILPVRGSTYVRPAPGVMIIKPPATVSAGTQLVVGAKYLPSTPYKSVYALTSARRRGPDLGEQFFAGSGAKLRCAQIGTKLRAGTTRYIQYQLVPKKRGGRRSAIHYKVSVR
jgi:hypothetical protein